MFFSFFQAGAYPLPTRRHRLAGTTTVDGSPARRLVVVLDRTTMEYVAAVQSDPITGAWEIKGTAEYPEQQLLIFCLDNLGSFNAEVADFISQVATV